MPTQFTFGPVKVLARKPKAIKIEYRGDRVWVPLTRLGKTQTVLLHKKRKVSELTLDNTFAFENGLQ